MFAALRSRVLPPLAAVVAVVGLSGSAEAGWVTIKNNTDRVIVVQELVVTNGVVKRGKPIRLLPGETVKEYQTNPCVKKVEVFDANDPARPLYTGNLNCKDENPAFSITLDGRSVSITPVPKR
jgi:hypothetical protein